MTGVVFPGSVINIGYGAFSYCSGLTVITIAAGVRSIAGTAFYGCAGLNSACFGGNAPEMGADVFNDCANDFTVYFTEDSTGFTAPWWHGYPAARSGGSPCPAEIALGNDNPILDKLRAIRDGPLAQTEAGRRITRIYYENAASINTVLDRSPVLRAVARKFFEAVAQLVDKKE